MDEKNYISNSTLVRQNSIIYLKAPAKSRLQTIPYTRCFSGLVELLRKAKGRGLYQVNPLFHFKGSEEQRQK
jgi:hypothetical protein